MRETIRHRPLVLLALFATLLMTSGCKSDPIAVPAPSDEVPSETISKEDIVATVGKVSISREQLMDRLLSDHGSETLRSLMLNEAVNEEAQSLGITVTEDELMQELSNMSQGYEDEAQFYKVMEDQLGMTRQEVRDDARYRLLIEKLSLRTVIVTQSEIDQYLEQHEEEFLPQRQYRIAHIVMASKEEAEQLLSQLAGGADFGAMARSYSLDEFSADSDGDLGWVESRDPFIAHEVLEAAASMQIGAIMGPIQTNQGYVIVQLNGKKEMSSPSETAIRMEIRHQLALSKAVPMKDMEQALLDKYHAQVVDPSLRP